ncbi:MAG: hypothetical protein QOG82_949 [Actinomycetota bacterium]|nr:hypothetical protein [Actinomycetota bacterium]
MSVSTGDSSPAGPAPLRIFIGTDASQVVAHQVLAHSIRRHASIPVEITPMLDLPLPVPVNPTHRARVEFTFTRFLIPELCRFEGRALYLDADMLVFGDVAELAAVPFDGAKVLCSYQRVIPELWKDKPGYKAGRNVAVMLLDCSRLDWDAAKIVAGLDEGHYTYEELVYDFCIVGDDGVADTIPPEWNHLEHRDPNTRLLHYTVVRTQPWKVEKNPLGHLWVAAFAEALEAGAVAPDDVEAGIAAGHLMPALGSFLHLAPDRRVPANDASAPRELALARMRIAGLERSLEQMRSSRAWRVGSTLAAAADAGRRLTRRARSAVGR